MVGGWRDRFKGYFQVFGLNTWVGEQLGRWGRMGVVRILTGRDVLILSAP